LRVQPAVPVARAEGSTPFEEANMLIRSTAVLCAVVTAGCSEISTTAQPTQINVPVQLSAARHTDHEAHGFTTHLSGREEVPVRDTKAQGQAIFRFNGSDSLDFKLIVANIENVTQAHIHCGAFGSNGPIVVWLYPPAPPAQLIPGRSQGVLAAGTITAANVIPRTPGDGCLNGGVADFDGLVERLRTGGAYVNVHTTQFLPGEIRGQID
jgi:hypothetical protein